MSQSVLYEIRNILERNGGGHTAIRLPHFPDMSDTVLYQIRDLLLNASFGGLSPSPHATTHAPGGSDPVVGLTNSSIDAAAGIVESKLSLNFPTHSNANDPTASEKAALAGTNGAPSGANKYVTDSDPRNTNSRVPTAHKSTHVVSGSDTFVDGDLLDATARLNFFNQTIFNGARRGLNFPAPTYSIADNITFTPIDDAANERMDLIAGIDPLAAGLAGSSEPYVTTVATAGLSNEKVFGNGVFFKATASNLSLVGSFNGQLFWAYDTHVIYRWDLSGSVWEPIAIGFGYASNISAIATPSKHAPTHEASASDPIRSLPTYDQKDALFGAGFTPSAGNPYATGGDLPFLSDPFFHLFGSGQEVR